MQAGMDKTGKAVSLERLFTPAVVAQQPRVTAPRSFQAPPIADRGCQSGRNLVKEQAS